MGTEHPSPGARRGPPAASVTAAALVLLVLAGCAQPSASAPARLRSVIASGPTLGVIREGWHTGLIVPESELTGALGPLRKRFAPAPFVVIGWGQRGYYMARDPGLLTGLAALFPSASVIHVRPWRPKPSVRPPRHRTWLRLPAGGWRGLRAFLGQAFAWRRHGHPRALGAHGRRGLFFASTETYDAFHTCNTWTMQALHAARLPAASTGVLFASQVRGALRATPLRRFEARPTTPFKRGQPP